MYEYLQQDDPFFFGFQHEDDDLPAYVLLHPKKTTWQARAGSEDPEYLSFVQTCLTLDPQERWTAAELLSHPFIAAERERSEIFYPLEVEEET